MDKIILELSYGDVILYNLKSTWIQPLTMRPGYMLCYNDDVYDRGIIYRSNNKQLLLTNQAVLMNKINNGEKKIRFR